MGRNLELLKTMFRYILVLFLSLWASNVSYSQNMIQGKVLDEKTKQPLQNANVYFNNTQIGVSTDEKGQFKLYADRIYNNVIISIIGYEKITVPIVKGNTNYTILLKERINTLNEVRISNRKDDWDKWGDLFFRLLLGNDTHSTFNCKILNPKDVGFYYDEKENYLEATTNKTLLIEHKQLGYKLHVEIDEFKYDVAKDELVYNASVYYENLPNKKKVANPHFINAVYYGSKMHFYRSLYLKTLEEEGFQLYRYSSIANTDKERVNKLLQLRKIKKMADRKKNISLLELSANRDSANYYKKIMSQPDVLKWDTTRVNYKDFLIFDSVKNKMIFKFSDTLMLIYKREMPLSSNVITKSTTTELKTLLCLADKSGIVVEPAGFGTPNVLYITGFMGDKRLAEQLPFDFVFKSIPPE